MFTVNRALEEEEEKAERRRKKREERKAKEGRKKNRTEYREQITEREQDTNGTHEFYGDGHRTVIR